MKFSSFHKQVDHTNDEQSPASKIHEFDISPKSKNLSPVKLKSFT